MLRRLPVLLGLSAVFVLSVGLTISFFQWQSNKHINNALEKAVTNANSGADNGVPSTAPISDDTFKNYTVSANQPRYIFINKLNVKAIVLSLGVTSSNEMQVPSNNNAAGWYNQSSLPGQLGAMLIDGHVGVGAYHGIFHNLNTLATGDIINIERGDGQLINYKVFKKQTYDYDKVDMEAALKPINSQKSGLNLITCTGEVIKGTNKYNQRLVVFTEQQ